MDPVSAAVTVAGLAGLCATISQRLYKCLGQSDEEDKALQYLKRELDSLQQVVGTFETNLKSTRPDCQGWSVITHSVSECRRLMGIIDAMCNRKTNRLISFVEDCIKPDTRPRD